jgi:hypothetical protein
MSYRPINSARHLPAVFNIGIISCPYGPISEQLFMLINILYCFVLPCCWDKYYRAKENLRSELISRNIMCRKTDIYQVDTNFSYAKKRRIWALFPKSVLLE